MPSAPWSKIRKKIGVLGKWNNDFLQFLPNFLYWFTWNHLYIYCLCFTPHRIQLNPYIIKTIQIVTKNWNIDSCELPCHQYFELNFKALGCFENSKFIIKSHVCGFVICIIVCAVGRQVDRCNPQIHIGTLKPWYSEQVYQTLFVHYIKKFTISNVICLVKSSYGSWL